MTLAQFLRDLLHEGKAAFEEPPKPAAAREAAALLERAYAAYRLQIAGELLPFAPELARQAAEVVRQACWFLFSHEEEPSVMEERLQLRPPLTPADHLSGDLTLRYLPQIYQRARVLAADDPLRHRLAAILRQWPLSGVLAADLADPPLTPPDFGHAGLQMLYAERLARQPRPGWLPEGPGRQQVELACREAGKNMSVLMPVQTLGEPGARAPGGTTHEPA